MTLFGIKEVDGHLKISVPWFRLTFLRVAMTIILIFCSLVFGAMAASSLGLLTSEDDDRSVSGFLFSSAAAIICLYVVAAYWLNRTILDVANDEISVCTRPFPLPRPRAHSLAINDLKQIFVQEIQNVCSDGSILASSWEVRALHETGERIVLLDISEVIGKWDETEEPALFIEGQIERFLGIDNVPVEKEVVVRVHERSRTRDGDGPHAYP